MSTTLYRYTERCDGIPCPMDCEKCGMDDDMYWELLEEQHAHDVVISGAQEGAEDGNELLRSQKSTDS